jgi:5'(3')-deoxyribonucleotidase
MASYPKIDPSRVAFDFDGVCADTMRLYLDIAREHFQVDWLRYEDIVCYNLEECLDIAPDISDRIIEHILDGSYKPDLKPISGATGVLTRLAGHREKVLFVTARPYLGPVADWIAEMLPLERNQVEVVPTGTYEGKTGVLLEKGISFFVEDRLETCFLLRDAGITPVLFRQPWNREPHDFMEVGSWSELEALIDFKEN